MAKRETKFKMSMIYFDAAVPATNNFEKILILL
jgi:hypothetical protein